MHLIASTKLLYVFNTLMRVSNVCLIVLVFVFPQVNLNSKLNKISSKKALKWEIRLNNYNIYSALWSGLLDINQDHGWMPANIDYIMPAYINKQKEIWFIRILYIKKTTN